MNKGKIIKGIMAVALTVAAILLPGDRVAHAAQPGQTNVAEVPVEILIELPEGYYKDAAKVEFKITGNDVNSVEIKQVKARAGRKGPYVDVTEAMSLEITEDCTVYVVAVDSKGKNYERSRNITCFDKESPTLNAAVSEGMLTVKAVDEKSGVKKIIVNGYEYLEPKNGELSIRLTQFDGGYEEFVIRAEDYVGNLSAEYRTANPYHKAKDAKDTDKDPAEGLPVSVTATNPTSSVASVTDHVVTDAYGNVINAEDIMALLGMIGEEVGTSETLTGKEFYTFVTASGKEFYLIIDKYSNGEQVRLLTDVSENDLLNMTSDNSQTLPRNSAAANSGIPILESALPNNLTDDYGKTREVTDEELAQEDTEELQQEAASGNALMDFINKNKTNVIMCGVAVVAIILGYYFKVVKKKRNADDDDDEDDGDDEGTSEKEEREDV